MTWPLAPEANRLGLRLNPELPSPLHVRELLEQLGQRGMVRVGWLEFGLMAPERVAWLAGHEQPLLRDRDGGTLGSASPGRNRLWLNPVLPPAANAGAPAGFPGD